MNDEDDVKVLIMTGAGRAFCAGADLSAEVGVTSRKYPGIRRSAVTSPFASFGLAIQQINAFTKPVIAAVNGPAVGGGLSIALAADIRIASDKAVMAALFTKRGLVPDGGVSYYLPRLVGVNKALELMWFGESIQAQEAERLGMVNHVVAHDQLMSYTKDLALRLAKGPSLAIEMVKRMAYISLKTDSVITQMGIEDYMQQVAMQSEDVKEGVAAFLQKRLPRFKGK